MANLESHTTIDPTTIATTHDSEHDPRNDAIKISVNGELFPRDEAKVSAFDSGFTLGDGVWQGLRVHNGKIGFLPDHLDRLYEAAKAIDLNIGMSQAGTGHSAIRDPGHQRDG